MELLYKGKTKNVYRLANGNNLLEFKDDVTGKDGKFDPGENSVGLKIEGMGIANLKTSVLFFDKLKEKGVKTHYISANFEKATMEVLPAKAIGMGLEVICRLKATGSFIKRYGEYISEGEKLEGGYVEATLKDDKRGDPLITAEGLDILKILNLKQFLTIKKQALKITKIVENVLQNKGMDLWDIKFEFGYNDNKIILIDEISSGNMRVYKDGKIMDPVLLASSINA